ILTIVPEREQELTSTADYMEGLLEISSVTSSKDRINSIDTGFWSSWDAVGDRLHVEFRQYLALRYLKKEIKNIVFGYGPLEDLLRLPSVSEIMVVDREHVYIERNGVLENSGKRFISDEVIETIIQRIVAKVSRRIDKSQPLVDARLSDGSRVNAVIAPLAVSGPTLTIRKFPYRKMLIDDLVSKGALTRTVAEFLRAIVLSRRNILISGGTGTGKTTLLNCLSDFIPDQERIVTVEDTAELQLAKEHVVRMETKEANVEGTGEYTIRDLVRNALRMRPDRIVVGECRGPEALDMLQAMNTGHDGSLTTIHANTAADVLLRLEVLVQMAADLPISSIHQQIGSAIDVVVQLKRLRDGRRVVSQISECTGVNPRTGKIELRDLYLMDMHADEVLQPTGSLPTFVGELIEAGTLNLGYFYHQQAS
ncbi:MAG: CpaF family protein, partial [Planctomycetaceae bacterium]